MLKGHCGVLYAKGCRAAALSSAGLTGKQGLKQSCCACTVTSANSDRLTTAKLCVQAGGGGKTYLAANSNTV
jgi:hypothetical protein